MEWNGVQAEENAKTKKLEGKSLLMHRFGQRRKLRFNNYR
jgi:hypothetical protein